MRRRLFIRHEGAGVGRAELLTERPVIVATVSR